MLASFIRSEMESILSKWENFARTLTPAASGLDPTALRDSAEEVLNAVADDMEQPQTAAEQADKSQGLSDERSDVMLTATQHAGERLANMFTLNQLVAEYRALRASVVGLWVDAHSDTNPDVQELTRFNEAIDQSLSEAIRFYDARLHQSRELFVAALAHDLRSPLGAIRSTADLLALSKIDDPIVHRAAQIVRDGSHKMAQIIDDLLDFTQIRFKGTLTIERAPTDLSEVCRSVVRELEAFHPDTSIDLNVPEQLPGVWDERRLNQVLANLIGNAISHGDSAAPVEVSVEVDGGCARVQVRNHGPAIPPHLRRAIFEPFVHGEATSEKGGAAGGMGLGLYISHQIVTEHGGSIELVSSEDDGTVFTVMLPQKP